MIDQKIEPLSRRSTGIDGVSSHGLVAAIKVKALLDFSEKNPEFQAELSADAAEAARQRGVELDASEVDLLIEAFVKLKS